MIWRRSRMLPLTALSAPGIWIAAKPVIISSAFKARRCCVGIAAFFLCALSGCDQRQAAQAEKGDVSASDDSVLKEHAATIAPSLSAQRRKIEGHFDGALLRSGRMPHSAPPAAQGDRSLTNESLAEQAASFASSDPSAGITWAKTLPDSKQRNTAFEALAWACAADYPGVSVEALEQLPASDAKSRLAAHVVGQWAVKDIEGAQAWAEGRTDAAERTETLAAFAVAIAELYPARAAALVAEKMQPGAAQDRAVIAVIQRWVQSDRRAAEQWVADFPNSPLKATAAAVINRNIAPNPPTVLVEPSVKDLRSR